VFLLLLLSVSASFLKKIQAETGRHRGAGEAGVPPTPSFRLRFFLEENSG
jgi:hypothetical protein